MRDKEILVRQRGTTSWRGNGVRRLNEMNSEVLVVGGGPAGYPAAIRAAQRGARVILVEHDRVGGICLHKGCIPTKALLEGTHRLHGVQEAKRFGVQVREVSADLETLRKHRDATIKAQFIGLESLLKAYGIRVVSGTGELVEPHAIRIRETGETLTASAIIVAVGSEPSLIPVPGADGPAVMNSDQAILLETVPEKMAIVGAGYVGLEFAQLYTALGCQVTVVEMMPQILPGEDPDVAAALTAILRKQRIDIHPSATVEAIEEKGEEVGLVYSESGERREVTARRVLLAVGRRSRASQLGLERIGVRLEHGCIAVNKRMETTVPGIFAAGDCVGGLMLAHKATREGKVAATNALGGQETMDTDPVPRCLYTEPEVACIGLTEPRARELHGEAVRVGRYPVMPNGRARAMGCRDGFAKVVTGPYGEILGIHMVGPRVTENIGAAVLAIRMEATVEDLARSIFPHPTISEILSEAAADALGECVHLPPRK